MKKFLKFIVIIFGFLIIILFSITIFAIYKKYNNYSLENINFSTLNPVIEQSLVIKDFQIEKNLLHLQLENDDGSAKVIRSYNIMSGKLYSEIKIK